ncbi:MAG: N,N-dimethylformamidase large subunit, partial [Pseudomonadota bacterium]|nr:N,N-dimethylformamidase large subunit [Pseudomonadota bacterium]
MKEIPLVGYADKFSLEPGETINFKVSSNSTRPYSARLVRVISGDPNPEGPGLIEEELDASFNGKYPSRKQDIQTGSYIKVDTKSSLKDLKSFTFGATIWPTMPNKYLQTIISTFDTSSKTGIIIEIGPNGLRTRLGDGTDHEVRLEVGRPISERRWYHVWVSFD